MRWNDEPIDDSEHLANQALCCPVGHGNGSLRSTHSHEFACDTVRPRRKHGPKQADDETEAAVAKRQLLGISHLKARAQLFSRRACVCTLDKVIGDIDADSVNAVLRSQQSQLS